ncbi:cation:proton antiporter [uncultured Corynebacterium sp.]|uniref:cation:proton antiporter n=1 Tax=uncultured Corynebacterium sp. TaxID=159447 RepID=UPI002628BF97|nr:cation:proton antiporter [uncultured Corynebacterium sp.]
MWKGRCPMEHGAITSEIVSVMWIMIAGLLSPLLSFATGKRVPGVVFMLVLGVVIGPHVLGLAESEGAVSLLRELGLGMLFLLAGWEIEVQSMRGRSGRAAIVTWAASFTVAFLAAWLIFDRTDVLQAIVLAIAVSSTAMGTLLPVVKDNGIAHRPVGRAVMQHGAVGELGPILAMALLLSTRATWLTLTILILFFVGALIIAFVPRTVRALMPWVERALLDGHSQTSQTVIRSVMVLLTALMALAAVFELDIVLGAFAAGIILEVLVPDKFKATMNARIDAVGYGFLIPIFFVTSGMTIDPLVIVKNPWMFIAIIVVILIARGLPIFLSEQLLPTHSGIENVNERFQLGLYGATALPIIVAVTDIAQSRELIGSDAANLLVCGGAATVLLFPMLASTLEKYNPLAEDSGKPEPNYTWIRVAVPPSDRRSGPQKEKDNGHLEEGEKLGELKTNDEIATEPKKTKH